MEKKRPHQTWKPPKAAEHNAIVSATDLSGRQLQNIDGAKGQPRKPRSGEATPIKIWNATGTRRIGDTVRLGDLATTNPDRHNSIFIGQTPDDAGNKIAILQGVAGSAVAYANIVEACCAGACWAWVEINEVGDPRADTEYLSHVLHSGVAGPVRILYEPPGDPGEKYCFVLIDDVPPRIWMDCEAYLPFSDQVNYITTTTTFTSRTYPHVDITSPGGVGGTATFLSGGWYPYTLCYYVNYIGKPALGWDRLMLCNPCLYRDPDFIGCIDESVPQEGHCQVEFQEDEEWNFNSDGPPGDYETMSKQSACHGVIHAKRDDVLALRLYWFPDNSAPWEPQAYKEVTWNAWAHIMVGPRMAGW